MDQSFFNIFTFGQRGNVSRAVGSVRECRRAPSGGNNVKVQACIIAFALAILHAAGAGAGDSRIQRLRPAVPLPVPRPADPAPPVAAPGPAVTPVLPPASDDCFSRLAAAGAQFERVAAPPAADAACIVVAPLRLTRLQSPDGPVEVPDHPLLACATAETFAEFTGEFFAPLAKGVYGERLLALGTGPGYDCRPRNHVAGAKTSAHGSGLAIDIAEFRLSAGPQHVVGEFSLSRDKAFDRAVRAGACGYFHTALGPGSDAAHARHWHMDLEARGSDGNSKFCR